jgi:(1->4)-alpha-D-glucan 1-alpha-D-glucosylmutase
MWQTLAGAWPLDAERLTGYLRKAMREAKTRTSWTDPDPEYESQVLTFAELVLADEELTGQIGRFVTGLAGDAGANALGAKLVQLTMPGVADTYQGCELAGLRLVDPDNRAPADFGRGRDLLAVLDAGDGPPGLDPGQLDTAKLLVTSLALRLRRAHPDWFAGEYTRWRPRDRRHGTWSASPGAGTRSPWSPGCPAACGAAAAGPVPCCPYPRPAPGGTC